MTLAERGSHVHGKSRAARYTRGLDFYEYHWPGPPLHDPNYGHEEELLDQLGKLPSPEEVAELCGALRVATLRELSTEVVNGAIDHAKRKTELLEHVKLINSWIATAEETVAAGGNVNRIAARRRKHPQGE